MALALGCFYCPTGALQFGHFRNLERGAESGLRPNGPWEVSPGFQT
jgi:hypothetical protein